MARSFSDRWSGFHAGPQVGKGLDQQGPVRLKCERTQRRELGEKGRAGSWKEDKGRERQRGNETPVMQKWPKGTESSRRQPAQDFRLSWGWRMMGGLGSTKGEEKGHRSRWI